jgi:hypothetical protein
MVGRILSLAIWLLGANMKSKHVVEEFHDIDNTPFKASEFT